jgi:hypothetical protein
VIVVYVFMALLLSLSVFHARPSVFTLGSIGLIIFSLSIVALVTGDDVDRCLDAGGSWSYSASDC